MIINDFFCYFFLTILESNTEEAYDNNILGNFIRGQCWNCGDDFGIPVLLFAFSFDCIILTTLVDLVLNKTGFIVFLNAK